MDLKSLALRTDLIFHRLGADIINRGDYIVIRTPTRPYYLWGNYVIMPTPPVTHSFAEWVTTFEREIGPRDKMGFMAITWDDPKGAVGEAGPFLDFGFKLSTSTIFTAQSVKKPVAYNAALQVRPLETDDDWNQSVDIHHVENWDYGTPEAQKSFLTAQRDEMRALVNEGRGLRFGAFAGSRLIAELGIYWEDGVARFNNVATRVDARRKGACSTLVYEASQAVLRDGRCNLLVLKAITDGPAANIYQAVGFNAAERASQLEWLAPST